MKIFFTYSFTANVYYRLFAQLLENLLSYPQISYTNGSIIKKYYDKYSKLFEDPDKTDIAKLDMDNNIENVENNDTLRGRGYNNNGAANNNNKIGDKENNGTANNNENDGRDKTNIKVANSIMKNKQQDIVNKRFINNIAI